VAPRIEYSQEKNELLKATRGINFADVIEAIEKKAILADLDHKNRKKYPNQRILVVKIRGYAYVVPYVLDRKRNVAYLKTIYPSRVATKKYIMS